MEFNRISTAESLSNLESICFRLFSHKGQAKYPKYFQFNAKAKHCRSYYRDDPRVCLMLANKALNTIMRLGPVIPDVAVNKGDGWMDWQFASIYISQCPITRPTFEHITNFTCMPRLSFHSKQNSHQRYIWKNLTISLPNICNLYIIHWYYFTLFTLSTNIAIVVAKKLRIKNFPELTRLYQSYRVDFYFCFHPWEVALEDLWFN